MAVFKKKKEDEDIPILKEQKELQKIVKEYNQKEKLDTTPLKKKFTLESREYQEFQKDRKSADKPRTLFGQACKFAGKHLNVGMKKKDEKKLNEILYYIGYNINARDVISLSILVFLIFLVMAGAMLLVSFPLALGLIVTGVVALFAVQQYPKYLQKVYTMETLNSMPLAITYMVIYMRSAPTLEGAVRFASRHLSGALARDMTMLLWGLETGVYNNMDEALKSYAAKWQDSNKNFSNALEILRNSQKIGNEVERLNMLNEAANVILKGNLEIMESFARSLKMPIIVLYMMCIVLPVMGLVIAPVMTTLMAQGLSANMLIIVYNIILPLFVYLFVKMILSKRPGSFMNPDITNYPGLPEPGHVLLTTKKGKEINLPLLPIALLIFVVIASPGILMFLHPSEEVVYDLGNIFKSMLPVWGAVAAIAIYSFGSSYQKLAIRDNVKDLENGLDIAVYTLGDRLKMGVPIEHAIRETAESMKSGAIKGFMDRVSSNMENAGMPFDKAIFDESMGAMRYYPSKLVRTIMEVLVESAQKGIRAAAVTMETIGHYLKNLKTVSLSIEDLLAETINTMKFQAQFMTSFITGIIIALDVLLFKILTELSGQVGELAMPEMAGGTGVTGVFQSSMFSVASAIPAEQMQIIVGVYMIEVTVLLSILINGIKNGRDNIYRNYTIGQNLTISTIVYTLALVVGVLMFSAFKI